jgi:hypothetical protein
VIILENDNLVAILSMELEMKILKQLRRYLWGPEKTDRSHAPKKKRADAKVFGTGPSPPVPTN